jgi:hypothetical protein
LVYYYLLSNASRLKIFLLVVLANSNAKPLFVFMRVY